MSVLFSTAPAIALAAFAAVGGGADPLLLVLPSDHRISLQARFEQAVLLAAKAAEDGALLTFGVTPDGPETAYGYIVTDATGDYILPLDADDIIDPKYCALAAAVLDERPEIGICYCRAALFGLKRGPWVLPPFSLGEMLVGNVIFVSAMFRRADWAAVGGFDESLDNIPEDHAFWLDLLQLGVGVYQLPEILFHYRIRKHSYSVKVLSGENRQWEAKRRIFRARQDFYLANLEALFDKAVELYDREQSNNKLLTYKLARVLARVERACRSRVKVLLGRVKE